MAMGNPLSMCKHDQHGNGKSLINVHCNEKALSKRKWPGNALQKCWLCRPEKSMFLWRSISHFCTLHNQSQSHDPRSILWLDIFPMVIHSSCNFRWPISMMSPSFLFKDSLWPSHHPTHSGLNGQSALARWPPAASSLLHFGIPASVGQCP